jgi:hypothetical protein
MNASLASRLVLALVLLTGYALLTPSEAQAQTFVKSTSTTSGYTTPNWTTSTSPTKSTTTVNQYTTPIWYPSFDFFYWYSW